MKPDITFIIPVYNGKPYLAEAVQSVLSQTCSHWKLLLVDDASTDESRTIIDSYSDPRIAKLYHDKNRGLYGSLVEAINFVDSEWIVILMQDDRLKPFYLEAMLPLIEKYPNSYAFWATEDLIGADGKLLVKGSDTSRIEPIAPGISPWISVLNRGCIWTISGSLTSRKLLTSTPFRTDLPHCGDYEWLLRAVRSANFVYYERSLAEIRIHQKQASATNLRIGRDIREYYKIIKQNLFNHAEDISRTTAFSICFRRVKLIMRRVISASLKGRLHLARLLVGDALRFLFLPFAYKNIG